MPPRARTRFEFFGNLAGQIAGERMQFGPDWAYTMRVPLGLCVGIGAWNYPTQIACWKGAPALACGNVMVFKPSEETPLAALKVAEILPRPGRRPGSSRSCRGAGAVGQALVTDPRVRKVSLTGSVATGRRVYAAAAEGMRHVTMELGGKSPLIVFADADLEAAVSGAILGNFYSSGQVCSNGTRVFVERGMRDAFLDRLRERLRGVVMGDPLDEAVNFGPMASARQMEIVLGYVEPASPRGRSLSPAGGGRTGRAGSWSPRSSRA
jgi:betaine-aldehyde dehydrogenase